LQNFIEQLLQYFKQFDVMYAPCRVPKHGHLGELGDLEEKIVKRKNQFRELEDVLPHENG